MAHAYEETIEYKFRNKLQYTPEFSAAFQSLRKRYHLINDNGIN